MRQGIKWGIIGLAGIAAALVVLFVVLSARKPDPAAVADQVSELIGRPVEMGGPMSITMWPSPRLKARDVTVSGLGEGEAADLLKVDRLEAAFRIGPLLTGSVRIRRLSLFGVRLNLVRAADGRRNWARSDGGGGWLGQSGDAASISGLEVDHGRVEYTDHQKRTHLILDQAAVELTGLGAEDGPELTAQTAWGDLTVQIQGEFPAGAQGRDIRLALSAGEASAEMDGSIKPSGLIRLRVDLPPFSPRGLYQSIGRPFPWPTAAEDRFTHLSLSGRITAGTNKIQWSKMDIELDRTRARCSGMLQGAAAMRLDFDLQLDQLDLNAYFTRPAPDRDQRGAEQKKRDLAVFGQVTADRVQAGPFDLTELDLKLEGEPGRLRLNPLQHGFYSGRMNASVTVDWSGPAPRTSVDYQADGVRLDELFQEIEAETTFAGAMSGTGQLTMTGRNRSDVLNSLGGRGRIEVRDGSMKGRDLLHLVTDALAQLKVAKARPSTGETLFVHLTAPHTIKNGIVHTDDTRAESPSDLTLLASGQIDLPDRTVDMRLEPRLKWEVHPPGETGEAVMLPLMVPIHVSGGLKDPKFVPQVASIQGLGALASVPALLLKGAASAAEDAADTLKEKIKQGASELEKAAE